MTASELNIRILSPERILFQGPVTTLGLPGVMGYMTLLPGHAEMVAQLDSGLLAMTINGKAEPSLFISGGFVDVSSTGVTVMADVIEKDSEIDRERVKKALARADERLVGNKSTELDVPRALRAKKRAEHRLELTGAGKTAH